MNVVTTNDQSSGKHRIIIYNEYRLGRIKNWLEWIREINKTYYSPIFRGLDSEQAQLFHYTSFKRLFDILDGDAFWASRSRFSNDDTEDMLLDQHWLEKQQYYGDNYIVCFSQDGDLLSQWRGYCPQGGASIELDIMKAHTYTLFHIDADSKIIPKGNESIQYENQPFPVLYSSPEIAEAGENDVVLCKVPNVDAIKRQLVDYLEDNQNLSKELSEIDIIPFMKNGFFFEEREFRLVFDNTDGSLEKCIRFRKDDDGSRFPYILLKYGNLLESNRDLKLTYTDEYVTKLFKEKLDNPSSSAINIPCGINQDDICRLFTKEINKHKKKIYYNEDDIKKENWMQFPVRIICDGHLPVRSITVSPSPQQQRMKEVIERFCRSRYWLQNVEVKCSPIPYIAPKI